MSTSESQIITAIARKLEADKLVDFSYQFPPPQSPTVELASGQSFAQSITISAKLKALSVSAPKGIQIIIDKDYAPWRRYINAFGTLQFPNGEYFSTFTVRVTNTNTDATADPVQWMVEAIFT